jgi:programmed cell death 6-interacting protein
MADLLAVPLKKPSDIDVIKPLKHLIASVYSSSDKPVDYSEEINEFSKLRNTALWKAFEKYESSLEIIYRYIFPASAPTAHFLIFLVCILCLG